MHDENTTVPYGYCQCGCGQKTRLYPANNRNRGWVKGEPYPYIKGHNSKKYADLPDPNPSGLCMCGCGEATGVVEFAEPKYGYRKGHHRRFAKGHGQRPAGSLYDVKDCGYQTPCWVWKMDTASYRGYGRIWDGSKKAPAHRHFYEKVHGPVDPKLHLDHLCRNKACVNPDHLEPVTSGENTRRGDRTTLTAAQVLEIRKSKDSRRVLAERYGVGTSNISAILRRRSWTDL